MDASQFQLGEVIGAGSFGEVKTATRVGTNDVVAIKILHLESVRDELENIQKEIGLLSRLDNPYVVQYLGSYLHGTDLNVVMEYMSGGSLRDIMKAGPLQESEISIVVREVLSGLAILHQSKVIHRDIKAANILLNTSGNVKIADFGVARELNEKARKFSVVGSPYWMAPEVIQAKKGGIYNEKADIWSLGITAIELAKGNPPRSTEKPMKVLVSIPSAAPPRLDGDFSAEFHDFVTTCLKLNPEERPSAKDLINHPFVNQAKDVSLLTSAIDRYMSWKIHNTSQEESKKTATAPIESSKYDRSGPMKKTSLEKFKVQLGPLETSSDSVDDWDLTSTGRASSPTGSIKESSSSAPNSPRSRTGDGLSRLPVPRPRPTKSPLNNAVATSRNAGTLSNSADETQYGSVIVHKNTDSESSAAESPQNHVHSNALTFNAQSNNSNININSSLDGIDEGAGEDEQYSSIIVKRAKKKDFTGETEKKSKTEKKSPQTTKLKASEEPSTPIDHKKDGSVKIDKAKSKATPSTFISDDTTGSTKKSKPSHSSPLITNIPPSATLIKDKGGEKDKEKKKDTATAKTKKKKASLPSSGVPESQLVDSSAILNSVIIPALSKYSNSEKVSALMASLTSIEAEIPGFSADMFTSMLRKFEKEQKNIPSIGINVVLTSTRGDYSDLSKYLLSRWKARQDSSVSAEDNYFM